MRREGRWLIPLLNGQLYSQKPPLFFGLAHAASLVDEDVPEWAVKAPSLLAALAALLALGAIGARVMGPEGAWFAPLLLGGMFKFSWQAQFGQIDMVVTALILLQVALGLRLAAGQGSRPAGILLMVLFGAAGVLAKGPVGCLLAWLVLLAYFLLRKDSAGLRRIGLPWIALGVAGLVVLWLGAAAHAEGAGYIRALVLRQSVQRYLEPWHHKAPAYYYLGILFSDGLPFSLLLVPLLAAAAKSRAWREPGVLLPLTWMAVYLAFFSLSSGKRSVYILPLFPAMALFLAYGLANVELGRWSRKGVALAYLVTTAVTVLVLVAGIWAAPLAFAGLRPWLLVGAAVLGASGFAAFRLAREGRGVRSGITLAAGSLLFMLACAVPCASILDGVKSPRALGERVRGVLEAGGTLGVFPSLLPSVNYYAGTITPVFWKDQDREALRFLLEAPDHLLLVEEKTWKLGMPPGTKSLGVFPVGDDRFVLLANERGASGGKRESVPGS
jgi:4-amino-4-deoxy-L-arabinose transferase-like glycosyltransferase